MPYGLSSHLDGEEPESVGKSESQSSTSERDECLRTPPTTPVRAAHSLDVSQEEEPEDPVFVTPPEGNKTSGTILNSPTVDEGDANGNFLGLLDNLAASPDQPATVRSTAGTTPSSPVGPEASGEEDVPPSVRSEEEPPTESKPVTASTWPSSPTTESEDSLTIPPFQFTQPLNVSTDSRGGRFWVSYRGVHQAV